MSFADIPSVYDDTLSACFACGKCREKCTSLQAAGMTLMEVASGMRNAVAYSEDAAECGRNIAGTDGLIQAVRGCFFCEHCVSDCEAGIDVTSLMYASRKVFQDTGLIPRGAYSSVLVDQEWHIFTAYRAIWGIGYPDLTRHIATEDTPAATDCAIAFFPGCSLAAYGPELTREVFAYIEQHRGKCTMIDECCGSPLKSAGFLDRAAALEQRIVDQVVASGAKAVVTVCPGCCNVLEAAFAARGLDIRAMTMAELLVEEGEAKRPLPQQARFFRSCQDRDGSYLDNALALFEGTADVQTICGGCCGAGGAVSAYSPEQQAAKVEEVLAQCESGDVLVSMCPTCAYTQAFQLSNTQRKDIVPKHYLELVFDSQFDWDKTFSQLGGMWTGEYGPWLSQVFA